METAQIVERLAGWVSRLMPAGERRDTLVHDLRAGFGGDHTPIDAARCAAIERTAWATARHVALVHEPGGTDPATVEAREWDEPAAETVAARAAGVAEVTRRPDGIGVLRIDGLDPAHLAVPYVDAAFALLHGARAVILDLRANGGGDPATVAHIAGRLLGDRAVKLSDVVADDRSRQWWTTDHPPGTALRQEVCALIGPGTFSSGEALAYHLRSHGRVTLVGERTPGAADHVLPIRLAPTVSAHIPRAYVVDAVTATNWEGTGVLPDIPCRPDEALNAAVEHLSR